MKKFYLFIFLLIILQSCTKFRLSKQVEKNLTNIHYIYTDDTAKTKKILKNFHLEILPIPNNFSSITPNTAFILWKANPSLNNYLSNLSITKKKIGKVNFITFLSNYLTPEELISYFLKNDTLIKYIYTDSTQFFSGLKNIKVYGINLKKIKRYYVNVTRGLAIIALFKNQNIDSLITINPYYDFKTDGLRLLANNIFPQNDIIQIARKLYEQYGFNRVYTNNPVLLKNSLAIDTLPISSLPIRYNFKDSAPNERFKPVLNSIRIYIDRGMRYLVYFYNPADTLYPTPKELKDFYKGRKFIEFGKNMIIFSDLLEHNSVVERIRELHSKYHFLRLYTNNLFILKKLLNNDTIKISWLPVKYVKDTLNPKYERSLNSVRIYIDRGLTAVVFFNTSYDTLRGTSEQLQEFFAGRKIETVQGDLIIFSDLLDHNPVVKKLEQLHSKYRFFRVYTNNVFILRKLINLDTLKISWLPIKYVNDTLNPKYEHSISSIRKYIDRGLGAILFFNTNYDTIRGTAEELKEFFNGRKIVKVQEDLIIMSDLLDHNAVVERFRQLHNQDSFKYVYTNNRYILRRLLQIDTLKISSLPPKYIKDTIPNQRYDRVLSIIRTNVDRGLAAVVYFDIKYDTLLPSKQEMENFFTGRKWINIYNDFIITSSYLKDKIFIDTFINLIHKYKFQRYYSNKIYLLKLKITDTVNYVWFPIKYNLKTKQLDTRYIPRVNSLKAWIISGRAMLIYFNDPTDTLRYKFDQIPKIFSPFYKIIKTPTSYLIISELLDYKNPKILNLDTNKYIYTNQFYIVKYLYHFPKVLGLPRKCIPPQCYPNNNYEYQFKKVRLYLTLDSAYVIFFNNPKDSIYPKLREIKNLLKYFKFEKFKYGVVIKSFN